MPPTSAPGLSKTIAERAQHPVHIFLLVHLLDMSKKTSSEALHCLAS